MSRIAPADPPYPAAVQARLETLMPPGLPPLMLFRVLARDQRLFERFMRGGLLDRGHLTLREREITILRVCANHRSEYEWGVHVALFATKARLSPQEVATTCERQVDDSRWSTREHLLLLLCDALSASTELDDALWSALAAEFTPEALLELLLLNGLYRSISTLTNSLRLPLEDFAGRFPTATCTAPSPAPTQRGSCLCGGVAYEIRGELGEFGYCHCRSCRKASGSAHAANAPVERTRFQLIRGSELVREFESSPGKLRAFCSTCGSPLYAYLRSTPDALRIRLGSLDTPLGKRPTAHTFVSDKADWDPIHDALPQFPSWAPKHVLDQRGSRQPDR